MPEKRNYRDERLNVSPSAHLVPTRENGVLTGLGLGRLVVPRPVLGLEHENNFAARLPQWERQTADTVCVQACLQAAASLGARKARGRFSRCDCGPCDRGRLIHSGPNGLPIHLYDDLSKLEVVFGEFTSARRVLAVEEALLPFLRKMIARAAQILTERYGVDLHLMLHRSGGDGNSTCAAVHLNIPWADAVAHAAYISLEAFDHLQESLVRQVALMTSVAAVGMPGEEGMLSDPRSMRFGHIVGWSTLEPHRAMQFNRLQGRHDEGYERQGCGRNMGMCVTWGQSQVGNLISLTLHQLEAICLHLAVAGRYARAKLLRLDDNLLTLAAELGTNRIRAIQLQRQALDDYLDFTAFLTAEVGREVVQELVPDHEEGLWLADKVLTALEQNDEDTIVRTTDYGKKMLLAERYLSGRQGSWRDNLDGIRNICFAFASPQEISPYYNYFRPQGLEMLLLEEEGVRDAGPDPCTRSYFFSRVVRDFWDDPLLEFVEFDWHRLVLRQSSTSSGGWLPRIQTDERTILLPASVGHNAAAVAELFDTQINSLEDVFEIFGTTQPAEAPMPAQLY
jgi:hypothetical protein